MGGTERPVLSFPGFAAPSVNVSNAFGTVGRKVLGDRQFISGSGRCQPNLKRPVSANSSQPSREREYPLHGVYRFILSLD